MGVTDSGLCLLQFSLYHKHHLRTIPLLRQVSECLQGIHWRHGKCLWLMKLIILLPNVSWLSLTFSLRGAETVGEAGCWSVPLEAQVRGCIAQHRKDPMDISGKKGKTSTSMTTLKGKQQKPLRNSTDQEEQLLRKGEMSKPELVDY